MDPRLASLLTELVEKVGLLRQDMRRKGDLDKYEARIARVDAMLSKLAEQVSGDNPDLAKALRTAWQQPGRSLAFRNVDHQKAMKAEEKPEKSEPQDDDTSKRQKPDDDTPRHRDSEEG